MESSLFGEPLLEVPGFGGLKLEGGGRWRGWRGRGLPGLDIFLPSSFPPSCSPFTPFLFSLQMGPR